MSRLMPYLLESAVCLALFYGIFWLFLKKETYFRLNRFYLVSSLLLSLLIPLIKVPSPFRHAPAAEEIILSPLPPFPPGRAFPVEGILLAVYAAGVLVFLARFVAHLAKLAHVVKKYGIRRFEGAAVVPVDKDFSPFSFLSVIFINDRGLDEGNLRQIIAHERVHIRQRHSLDIILVELVSILQWFNPFVRPYKKSIQETHEYLADDEVIAQGFSPAKYQLLMLEQHVGLKLFELANNFKQSQFKRRITMMSKTKSGNAAKLKLLLVLPLASFLVLAFADPRSASKPGAEPAASLEQSADPSQETQASKEKTTQAEEKFKELQKKEALLREKMASTDDPAKKAELKKTLERVAQDREEIGAFLHEAQAGAVSAPDKNGTPEVKGGGKPVDASLVKQASGLDTEFDLLTEKEKKIRQMLETSEAAEERAELKAKLVEVLDKKAQVKAAIQANGHEAEPSLEKLEKEYALLKAKEADVRAMLEKAEDPAKRAELKTVLENVRAKQEMVKAKAEALKAGRIEKSK